jgi:hypothetical protein
LTNFPTEVVKIISAEADDPMSLIEYPYSGPSTPYQKSKDEWFFTSFAPDGVRREVGPFPHEGAAWVAYQEAALAWLILGKEVVNCPAPPSH